METATLRRPASARAPEPPGTPCPPAPPTPDSGPPLAVVLAGAVCQLLGIVVLIGWWAGLSALVRVSASHTPVQPNTALGFVLGGSALLLFAYGRRAAGAALGAAVAAIGALTTAEYLFGFDLGIDRLLAAARDGVLGAPAAGRMAPQTACGLALAGLALALAGLRSPRVSRGSPIVVALLGAGVVALGAVSLGGYAIGLSEAYGWAGSTRVAVLAAAGLVTLGVGLLSIPFPAHPGSAVRPRTIAVAVGTLAAALLLWQALAAEANRRAVARLSDRARAVARLAEERLDGAVESVRRFARSAAATADPSTAARVEADEAVRHVGGLVAVGWAGKEPRLEWVVTRRGVGIRSKAIEAALASAGPDAQVTARLPAMPAMAVAVPIEVGGEVVGRLVGVVDLRARLEGPVLDALAGGDEVSLEEGGERVLGLRAARPVEEEGYRVGVASLRPSGAAQPWRVTVRPAREPASAESALPVASLLGVSLLGALLALALHLGDRSRSRARQAERASCDLLLEVEYRRRVEEERDNFFSISPDLLCVVDAEGRFLHVNDAWRRTLGLGLEELHAQPLLELVHPEDRSATLRAAVALARGRGVSRFEVRCRAKDGSWHWLQWAAAGVPERGRIYATARDVTEARLAAAALKDSEAQFRAVAETANDAIVCADRLGRISYFNRAAERAFGRTAAEVDGASVACLVPDRLVVPYRELLEASLDGGAGASLFGRIREGLGRRQDGTEFPMEVSAARWTTEAGPQFAAIVRDVTERKRAEAGLRRSAEELRRSNEELQQFAYVASHDLQEPLRMVASYTDLLGRRYAGRLDADADEFIAYAVDGARRMQRLIEDLLEYARVGTRGKPLAPVHARAALDRALTYLRPSIEEAKAEVVVGDLPTVFADEGQLVQLFQNLLGNAVKFRGSDPPRVVVSARRGEGEWVFSVADNGIGISSEHFERIFQVFQRLHRREEYSGNGIGLAICKRIVDRHRGRIWIESAEGKGATFFFSLPDREAH